MTRVNKLLLLLLLLYQYYVTQKSSHQSKHTRQNLDTHKRDNISVLCNTKI